MIIVKPAVILESEVNYEDLLLRVEKIGRVCYKSEEYISRDSAVKFVSNLIKRGHESVLEHIGITVRVICDRGVSHEIVRHRIASYSQESTRYCNYTKDKFENQISVIDIASGFKYDLDSDGGKEKYLIWNEAMEKAEEYYFRLIKAGATPEEARSVLPNSLKTELVITMNIREWRHFFRLRLGRTAHPQMRETAGMIFELLHNKMPAFFDDIIL